MNYLKVFFILIITVAIVKPINANDVGIEEKLGKFIALDVSFYDENGKTVKLKELINKPTILSLVYFSCHSICTPLLHGLADTLNELDLEPVKDYSVITISFNTEDTPAIAYQQKNEYLKMFKKKFPENAWKFLTGDNKTIMELTDSVGFKFKKEGKDFAHPIALIILSSDGKITRYLHGISFLPFDLKMAIIEASKGKIGLSVNRVLQYCFGYEPKARKYTLNVLKLSGTAILFFIVVFFSFLVIKSRIKKHEV